MPKAYIIQKSFDVLYLRNFYRKLIKSIIFFYIIIGACFSQIIIYNFSLNKNDYIVITTFGKLIEIFPQK